MRINTLTSLLTEAKLADPQAYWRRLRGRVGELIFLSAVIPTIGTVSGRALPLMMALLRFAADRFFLIVSLGLMIMRLVVGNFVQSAKTGKVLNLSSPVVILLVLGAAYRGSPTRFSVFRCWS